MLLVGGYCFHRTLDCDVLVVVGLFIVRVFLDVVLFNLSDCIYSVFVYV